jgi:hypothetical protein
VDVLIYSLGVYMSLCLEEETLKTIIPEFINGDDVLYVDICRFILFEVSGLG